MSVEVWTFPREAKSSLGSPVNDSRRSCASITSSSEIGGRRGRFGSAATAFAAVGVSPVCTRSVMLVSHFEQTTRTMYAPSRFPSTLISERLWFVPHTPQS